MLCLLWNDKRLWLGMCRMTGRQGNGEGRGKGSFHWKKRGGSQKLLGNRIHWFWRLKARVVSSLVEMLLLGMCIF